MPLFKKKGVVGKGYAPVERVRDLASKGFSEPEIIDILRAEGFSPEEIDKGLTEALRLGVTEVETALPAPPPKKEEPKVPTLEEITPRELEVPEVSLPAEEAAYPEYTAEEYIDYVVGERIREVLEKMEESRKRQEELEKKLSELSGKLSEITKAEAMPKEDVLARVEETKSLIEDLNARVGSLERAFKEILPAMVESVRALSELVKRAKRSS